VPTTVPVAVATPFEIAAWSRPAGPREAEVEGSSRAVASQEVLLGFRSRCTIPRSWAAASPRAICCAYSTAFARRQSGVREPVPKRLALKQLHDRVGDVALAAVVCGSRGCWDGTGRGDRAGLPLEAHERVGRVREWVGITLDRDLAAEAGVAGAIDLAHPARAERLDDLVSPSLCPAETAMAEI
jgi:hypothetical protein